MMNKKKIQYSVTSLLVVVFLFTIIRGVSSVNKTKAKRKQIYSAKNENAVRKSSLKNNATQKPTVVFKSFNELLEQSKTVEIKRDPFSLKPQQLAKEKVKETLTLEGILWDGSEAIASINGTLVKVGDSVGKYLVIYIDEESILVSDGVDLLELHLPARQ